MLSLAQVREIAKQGHSFASQKDIEARDLEAKDEWNKFPKRTRDKTRARWMAEACNMASGDRESVIFQSIDALRDVPFCRS